MSVIGDICAHLKAQSGVTDIVSTRVYAEFAPANVWQNSGFVIVRELYTVEMQEMAAPAADADSEFQIDAYHKLGESALSLRDAIRTALHGFDVAIMNSATQFHHFRLRDIEFDTEMIGDGQNIPFAKYMLTFDTNQTVTVP